MSAPPESTPSATSAERGLTAAEVAERVADGRVNTAPPSAVRTVPQIIAANVFTTVNGIMIILFVLIIVAGAYKDALFVGVVVSNSVIGVVQEIRAKRELERLAVLSAPRAQVIRDGRSEDIDVEAVVQDDVLDMAPGNEIVVDGEVIHAVGLEVDESLLTGESDAIVKGPGDEVMSGAFVSSGSGLFRATRIGADSYAATLSAQAREFSLVNSELRSGIDWVLRVLTWIIPPASALLFWSLLRADEGWRESLRGTVAAAVAMVPDGLVLLTSLAFMAGVVALARREALAKELATVELLARVDVLCLDKTGTITTGEISLGSIEPCTGNDAAWVAAALGGMGAADPKPNPTLQAIIAHHPAPESGWNAVHVEPFASARKWAAVEFADEGLFYFGAPDILLSDGEDDVRDLVRQHSEAGTRVLLLSRSDASFPRGDDPNPALADDRNAVALILLEDTMRPDAPEIFRFFRDQGVTLKVISGDNAATVGAVAGRAGVPNADRLIDARTLPDDDAGLAKIMSEQTVFGRVTPHQKQAMVKALQSQGHTVAMTGDGVNDVLALKNADMGIAMGAGSEASRSVAQLVLLDNKFATLPQVLAEGRKVINNIERVANLFVAKATYAVLITAVIGIMSVPFPFLPRHLTLIGTFSIGLPGLALALAPNQNLVRPGFIKRVLAFSLPVGAIAGIGTLIMYEIARRTEGVLLPESRTIATMTLLGFGLMILLMASRPLKAWKVGLVGAMVGLYVVIYTLDFTRTYFELVDVRADLWRPAALIVAIGGAAIIALVNLVPGLRPAARADVA